MKGNEMKNTKTKKTLKLKDTESVAALFADDLYRYFQMGGDMNNLTAKKVYSKLRGSDEKVYEHIPLDGFFGTSLFFAFIGFAFIVIIHAQSARTGFTIHGCPAMHAVQLAA